MSTNSDTPTPSISELATRYKSRINSIQGRMRITKVVATRAVKTKNGDFFCGMSSAWHLTQDVSDLDSLSDGEQAQSGMTIPEARICQLLLSVEAAQGALRAAITEGAISVEEYDRRVRQIKQNMLIHLSKLEPGTDSKPKESVS